MMNTFCWIHSTYTSRTIKDEVKTSFFAGTRHSTEFEENKSHDYHRWICVVLFMQAAAIYLPSLVWKVAEGGKVKLLIQDLQVQTYFYRNTINNF
jgi:hypothetical protein